MYDVKEIGLTPVKTLKEPNPTEKVKKELTVHSVSGIRSHFSSF